jgi:hypothetical protein
MGNSQTVVAKAVKAQRHHARARLEAQVGCLAAEDFGGKLVEESVVALFGGRAFGLFVNGLHHPLYFLLGFRVCFPENVVIHMPPKLRHIVE